MSAIADHVKSLSDEDRISIFGEVEAKDIIAEMTEVDRALEARAKEVTRK